MASAWSEEETFVCSVCLDTLKDPATLPCGHTYCLACIQSHWDKKDSKGECSCPQCRQVFKPRPSLAKSTVLVEAMEKLRTNSFKQSPSSAPPSMPVYMEVLPATVQRQGSIYPQIPSVEPRPCPQHNQPMDLFCRDDKECVCKECCQHGHKGHQVLKPEEERRERQKELVQMQADTQKKIQETKKQLNVLPHTARQHKALVQALEQESSDLFSELVKKVNQTGIHIGELLGTYEASLGSQVEGKVNRLEQEAVQLRWKSEELSRLAGMQDHVCFLKNFFTMEPPGQTGSTGEPITSLEKVEVSTIRSVLKELQEAIQEQCKGSLTRICTLLNQDPEAAAANGTDTNTETETETETAAAAAAAAAGTADGGGQSSAKNAVYEMISEPPPLPPPRPQVESLWEFHFLHSHAPPPTKLGLANPDPKTRAELLKFRFEPTMDPNTAYRHIQLSDEGHKAALRAENLNPPDHPERFDFWRQVLCREPLAGSPYYWEVEWTGQKVTIGVANKEMDRKGSDDKSRLGHNNQSWSLYWSGTGFSFWHDSKEKLLGSPKARRIGVYLDQHAGILAFYRISHNQADLIHRYQTQFAGPLYPGFRFWAGVRSEVSVCSLD
ncbi:finTRIM family%2C member 86 [Xyrichtys novacula]|uniref:FinTRIM family, member 86 n=1 Tax=Xyrichtys novacula TaxID=13765 RepID=A0AAV1FZR6_XYRNO|nr:finTRIM family%2C member 86 [Xyrichtys novacula]